MPLIILGILVLLCILAYSIVRYIGSGEEDTRTVRERYPDAFPPRKPADSNEPGRDKSSVDDDTIYAEGYVESDSLRGDIEHKLRGLKEYVRERADELGLDTEELAGRLRRSSAGERGGQHNADNTVEFPTGDNIEEEKRRRNIH